MSADNGPITVLEISVFSRLDRFRRHVKTTDSPSPLITNLPNRKTNEANTRQRSAVAATLFRTKERTRTDSVRPQLQSTDLHESEKKLFSPFQKRYLFLSFIFPSHICKIAHSQFSAAIDGCAYLNMN